MLIFQESVFFNLLPEACICCYLASKSCATLLTSWTAALQFPPSSTFSWSLLKFMSIESVMLSTYLILCHPLLLLPSLFPSIVIFSKEWALLIKWPKYWSFSFSISPSNEYSRLISFRIDWFDSFPVYTCWCFLKAELKNKTDVSCSVGRLSLSLQFAALCALGCSSLGFRPSGVSWTWWGGVHHLQFLGCK